MSSVDRNPERGRAVAARLTELGVKGTLIKAAEEGYISQLACMMPKCFCPEELGGAFHFEPVTKDWSDWRSDWMPTLEHFPVSKKEGGKAAVDNATPSSIASCSVRSWTARPSSPTRPRPSRRPKPRGPSRNRRQRRPAN